MKIYQQMPHENVSGWQSPKDVRHAPGSEPFHYHEVEEWLEVLEGTITFFPAALDEPPYPTPPYSLVVGQALSLQPGEVHRAEIGPDGVRYRMWLPVEIDQKTFQRVLENQEVALVKRNLGLPAAENGWLKRQADVAITGNPDGNFLDDFTSADLIFRGATGKFLTKESYLRRQGGGPVSRSASDSVCILYRSAGHLLLSTVVGTQSSEPDARASYTNIRFFVREGDGSWRCRVWMNFPEAIS